MLGGGFDGLLLKVVDEDDGAFGFFEAQQGAVEEFEPLGAELGGVLRGGGGGVHGGFLYVAAVAAFAPAQVGGAELGGAVQPGGEGFALRKGF